MTSSILTGRKISHGAPSLQAAFTRRPEWANVRLLLDEDEVPAARRTSRSLS
jgi:hypothetical protein